MSHVSDIVINFSHKKTIWKHSSDQNHTGNCYLDFVNLTQAGEDRISIEKMASNTWASRQVRGEFF